MKTSFRLSVIYSCIFYIVLICLPLNSHATSSVQGSGIIKTEERILQPFHSIHMDGSFHIHIICQKDYHIEIKADDNLLPHIITKIGNDTLHVYSDASFVSANLIGINIFMDDSLIALNAAGTNQIRISDMESKTFTIEASGTADIFLSGKTGKFAARLAGVQNMDAFGLSSEICTVLISGSSSASVQVSEELEGTINGFGNIVYCGNPRNIRRKILGIGKIIRYERCD